MSPAREGGWVVPMPSAPTPARLLLPSALAGAVVTAVLALLLVRGMTYRATVAWSLDLPGAVQEAFAVVSDYGILALMALFGVGALVARRDGVARLAKGVAAGVGVVLAYLSSEAIKVLVGELRPCHNFSVTTINECPASTDWSWPSNHATIAVAIAIGVWLMSARLGALALMVGGLIAVSRVVVGVHYAHDVAAGALVATVLVLACARWGTAPTRRMLHRARRAPALDRLIAGRRVHHADGASSAGPGGGKV